MYNEFKLNIHTDRSFYISGVYVSPHLGIYWFLPPHIAIYLLLQVKMHPLYVGHILENRTIPLEKLIKSKILTLAVWKND